MFFCSKTFARILFLMIAEQKGFRSAFAQEINVLMSDYVLFGGKAGQGLPELVAHLLIANWPREHARCDLESNDILFCIISSIKGWLETIIGEVCFGNFSSQFILCVDTTIKKAIFS